MSHDNTTATSQMPPIQMKLCHIVIAVDLDDVDRGCDLAFTISRSRKLALEQIAEHVGDLEPPPGALDLEAGVQIDAHVMGRGELWVHSL